MTVAEKNYIIRYRQMLLYTDELLICVRLEILGWVDHFKSTNPIVTPSQWLANQVKDSFLASFPVRVINNGIDFQTFCYCESDFRSRNNLGTKIVILGVAFD